MHALGRRALAAHHASRLSRPARPRSSIVLPQLLQRRAFRPSVRTAKQEDGENGISNDGAKPDNSTPSTPPETSKEEVVDQPSPAIATTVSEEPESTRKPQKRATVVRGRALKSKKHSQLPRVSFPPRFFRDHVLLHSKSDSLKGFTAFNNSNVVGWEMLQGLTKTVLGLDLCCPGTDWGDEGLDTLEKVLEMVEWKEHLVADALDGDIDAVARRGELTVEILWSLVMARELCFLAVKERDPNRTKAESASPKDPESLSMDGWFKRPSVYRWSGGSVVGLAMAFCHINRPNFLPGAFEGALRTLMTDTISQEVPSQFLLPWLDFAAYQGLRDALEGEFVVEPMTKAQLSGNAKRPITLMTIPNYNGKMFSKAAVSAVATSLGADLITLDARTLSVVVGEYLGHDWSYARDPISMLGFKVADINGRLGRSPELDGSLAPPAEDEDGTTTLNVQTNDAEPERTPMERELQRIKDGARDYVLPSVDKWDNIKINAVLEQLVQAANIKTAMTGASTASWRGRRMLLHIDDFVELSMTLEGSLLVGRLRNIIDTLWQHGYKVAIVGTSSFEKPTEQFLSTLSDLTAEECHITCPLHLSRASFWGLTTEQYRDAVKSREPPPDGHGASPESDVEQELRQHVDLDTTQIFSNVDGIDASAPFEGFVDQLKHAEYWEETVRNVVNVLRTMSVDAAASLRSVFDSFQKPVIHPAYLHDEPASVLPPSGEAKAPTEAPTETEGSVDTRETTDKGTAAGGADADQVAVGGKAKDAIASEEAVPVEGTATAEGAISIGDATTAEGATLVEDAPVVGDVAATEGATAAADTAETGNRDQDTETGLGSEDEIVRDLSPFPKSILPHTVVYDIARQFCQARQSHNGLAGDSAIDVLYSLLTRRKHWAALAESRAAQQQPRSEQVQKGSPPGGPATANGNAQPKFDDHEKRLLPGLIKADSIKTTFKDIHLPKETIATVKLLTSLSLVRPDALSYGILAKERMPGCLLYGPPGTGKTLLAKAMAKESGANVLEVTGASIEDMWVGESEKNVRALFSLAKKLSPMVVFIDEADSLLGSRSLRRSRPTRRETLNQFLREWDGMTETSALIMVATNRPDDLDDAILRRLPRKILVDLPLEADRAVILNIFLKDEKMDESVSIEKLAKNTPFYSGSDLKNLCVASAMAAVSEENEVAEKHQGPDKYVFPERRILRQSHFDQALKEVTASVNADTPSLKALRKFDEMYGKPADAKKTKSMGFGVAPPSKDAESARIRKPEPA